MQAFFPLPNRADISSRLAIRAFHPGSTAVPPNVTDKQVDTF